jgi:hypothetical protein
MKYMYDLYHLFLLYLHVKIILEQNYDRNTYKIYKLFIFINVGLNWGLKSDERSRSTGEIWRDYFANSDHNALQ